MEIIGLEGMTNERVNYELQRGAKFVLFEYCISIIIMTFKRPSSIYFIRAEESVTSKALGFSLISLLLGWWGIPWGPIYTVSTIFNNLTGGKDVTQELLMAMNQTAVTA